MHPGEHMYSFAWIYGGRGREQRGEKQRESVGGDREEGNISQERNGGWGHRVAIMALGVLKGDGGEMRADGAGRSMNRRGGVGAVK